MKSSVLSFLKNVLTGNVRFSASPRLLGRFTAGAGAGEEIKIGAGLAIEGDTLKATGGVASITSSQISDATNEPVGSEAYGKAVLYDSGGGIKVRKNLNLWNDANTRNLRFSCEGNDPVIIFTQVVPPLGGNLSFLRFPSVASNADWTFPANAVGILATLPPFANATAANAVVSVGDAWWDTTLNKARVRLS